MLKPTIKVTKSGNIGTGEHSYQEHSADPVTTILQPTVTTLLQATVTTLVTTNSYKYVTTKRLQIYYNIY